MRTSSDVFFIYMFSGLQMSIKAHTFLYESFQQSKPRKQIHAQTEQ